MANNLTNAQILAQVNSRPEQIIARNRALELSGVARVRGNPSDVIKKNPSLGYLRGYDLWTGMILAHGHTADHADGGGFYRSRSKEPIKSRIKWDSIEPDIQQALLAQPTVFFGFVNMGHGDYWVDHYRDNNKAWTDQHIGSDIMFKVLLVVAVAAAVYFGGAYLSSVSANSTSVTSAVTQATGGGIVPTSIDSATTIFQSAWDFGSSLTPDALFKTATGGIELLMGGATAYTSIKALASKPTQKAAPQPSRINQPTVSSGTSMPLTLLLGAGAVLFFVVKKG